jgi:hypothetical protein
MSSSRATVKSDAGTTEHAIARRRYNRRSSSRSYLDIPLNALRAIIDAPGEPEERRSISTSCGTPPREEPMLTDPHSESRLAVFAKRFAAQTAHGRAARVLDRAFAWVVGLEAPTQAPQARDDAPRPHRGSGVVRHGVFVPLPYGPIPDPTEPSRGIHGPRRFDAFGKYDGATRLELKGMFGCDCECMYGTNDCPSGDSMPGGAVWCFTVEIHTPEAGWQLANFCYADCFSASGPSHGDETTCVNARGRTCFVHGALVGPRGERQWPDGQPGFYDCSRVVDPPATAGLVPPDREGHEQIGTIPDGLHGH